MVMVYIYKLMLMLICSFVNRGFEVLGMYVYDRIFHLLSFCICS